MDRALRVVEPEPVPHVHRFPAALASHTSFNSHSSLQHEPSGPQTDIPPGVEFAAMNMMPYEMVNMSPMQQRWARYNWERQLRNPGHITQGLDIRFMEAEAEYPLLVPRRQDFKHYHDYVHAVRDFSMELHRLQFKAERERLKHHPKVRHYIDVVFRNERFEKIT